MREISFLSSFCIRVSYTPPKKENSKLSHRPEKQLAFNNWTGIQHPRGIQQLYN